MADCILLGPVRAWSDEHDAALQVAAETLGALALRVGPGHVAAKLPTAQLDGINRWRWLAAALLQPRVTMAPDWRDAAARWVPTASGGTVRMLTEAGWTRLVRSQI